MMPFMEKTHQRNERAGLCQPGSRLIRPGSLLPNLTLIVAFEGLFMAAVLSLGHVLDLPVPRGTSAERVLNSPAVASLVARRSGANAE
jgi:hypothetical protein